MSGEPQTEDAGEATETESPETVQLAKDMGWKDPAGWRGDPPKNGFVSASEFVRRSEKILPIVNARAKKAEDEAKALRGELETTRTEHRQTIARIERMSTLALDQQREQIEDKYTARKEAAVEIGDKPAYQQAVKDEREATKALDERLKEPEEDKAKTKSPELPKTVQDTIESWRADNRWYVDDATDEMTAYANARHAKLLNEKKGLSLKENLEQVTADVRKRFPEQFGDAEDDKDEPKPRGSRVEGGSRNNGGGAGGSQWMKVPGDIRKVAENAGHIEYFLKSGESMDKDASRARERWAAKYLEGETA